MYYAYTMESQLVDMSLVPPLVAVVPELPGHKVLKDLRDRKGFKAQLVCKGHRDLKVTLERQGQQVHRDQKVILGLLALTGQLDLKDPRVTPVIQVQLVLMVHCLVT
jgi:hypothetical protein